jgi:hypothetical protein
VVKAMNPHLGARKDAFKFIWLMLGKKKEDQPIFPENYKESDIDTALRSVGFDIQ